MRVYNRPRMIEMVVNYRPGSVEFRTIREKPMTRNQRFASMTSRPMRRLLLTLVGHMIFCLFETSAPGQPAAGASRQQANPPGSSSAVEPPATDAPRTDALIGKFEILATYTYAKALRAGLPELEAKQRGIVAAVMGARSRGVSRGGPRAPADSRTSKQDAATRKQTLTAATFDQQVATKMQPFYGSVFLPTMKKLVDSRLTYDQVKNILEIPPAVGAKITAKQFEERTAAYWKASGKTGPR